MKGNSVYYDYYISNNGATEYYGYDYDLDYYTDNVKRQGLGFLEDFASGVYDTDSFLMVLAPPACHDPFTPAPQYNFTNLQAERTPNWNWTRLDTGGINTKGQIYNDVRPFNQYVANIIDQIYSQRIGVMMSVDDMVEELYLKVDDLGLMDDTIWIYTSDHGYHLGTFGLGWDKRQLYEEDIKVPFVVLGPGIPQNAMTSKIALNVDIAPTLIELTTGDSSAIPAHMDGQSLVPWIYSTEDDGLSEQVLVEYWGEIGFIYDHYSNFKIDPELFDGWQVCPQNV